MKDVGRQNLFWIGITLSLFLAGCGSKNSSNTASTSSLSCTATASLVSPSVSIPNSAVVLSNLLVTISQGSGAYTISVPGLPVATLSQTSFSYSNSFSAATDASGGVSVSVSDVNTKANTTCEITLPGSSSSNSNSGSNSNPGSGSASPLQVVASPGTSVPLATPVTLVVNSLDGTVNPTFVFTEASAVNGLSITQNPSAPNQATLIYSLPVATTATITVTEFAANSATAIASTQVTISFGQSSTSGGSYLGSIACELFVNGVLASQNSAQPQPLYLGYTTNFQVVSQTGEALEVTQISPGENWSTPPVLPFPQVFNLNYATVGVKQFSLSAQSAVRPGYVCNSNNPLIAWLSFQ